MPLSTLDGLTYQEKKCPVCNAYDFESILPTVKYDSASNTRQVHDVISVGACRKCGAVYENPMISLTDSEGYSENHYYNAQNAVEHHNKHQQFIARFRWGLMQDRLDWSVISRTLDVGAIGAWSNIIAEKVSGSRNTVLEPSSQAVAFAKSYYPDIEAVNGVFEGYDGPDGDFDLITFYYSFYCLENPMESLRKVKRLLKRGGKLLINISHVLMRHQVWGRGRKVPWVDLEHVVRGVPLVYYSPTLLREVVEASGFAITDDFTAQYPLGSHLKGRQEHFLIAQYDGGAERGIRSMPEVFSANAYLLRNFSLESSRKSIKAYTSRSGHKTVTLVYDNEDYMRIMRAEFSYFGTEVSVVKRSDLTGASVAQNSGVLVITESPLTDLELSHLPSNTVDTIVREDQFQVYGLLSTDVDGHTVVARACLPCRDHDINLFPFPEPDFITLDYELTQEP